MILVSQDGRSHTVINGCGLRRILTEICDVRLGMENTPVILFVTILKHYFGIFTLDFFISCSKIEIEYVYSFLITFQSTR